MKDILKRFSAAPWPQKIVFVLVSPAIVAIGMVFGAFFLFTFIVSTAYKILTGDELYD